VIGEGSGEFSGSHCGEGLDAHRAAGQPDRIAQGVAHEERYDRQGHADREITEENGEGEKNHRSQTGRGGRCVLGKRRRHETFSVGAKFVEKARPNTPSPPAARSAWAWDRSRWLT